MIQIEKNIFDGEYFSFRNMNRIVNNCGIASKSGEVVISERFENVLYSVGDWAIVTTRYRVYTHPEDVYYGLIDKDMNIIIDPDTFDFYGYLGYLQVEKILSSLYEEKYDINSKKSFFNEIVDKKR